MLFVSSYLPTAACFSVVGEVVTDPLVDLTEGHPFARRAVDCKGDEAGVAVGWFTISVLRSLLLVQRCSWIQVDDFFARPVPVMVAVVVVSVVVAMVVSSSIWLLDGCPHAELGEPVHWGQATLQFRGHGACRSTGQKGRVRGSATWRMEDLLLAHWMGAVQQPWLKSGRAGGLFTTPIHLL